MMEQTQTLSENNLFFPIILLLLLPLFLFIFKHMNKTNSSSPPLPPAPFSWPIVGNIFQMGNKPHITLTHFAKFYGPLFSIKLGTQLIIVGSSQESAIEILKTRDRILSGRSPTHASPPKSMQLGNLSVGWIGECNEQWKHLRTIIKTEIFSGKAMESQGGGRDKMIKNIVNFIAKMEGKVVKVKQIAFAGIFNMLGNILVSKDIINFENESIEAEIGGPLRLMLEIGIAPNVSDYFPILAFLDLQGLQKKGREWYKEFCNIWEDIIKERREKNGNGDNLQTDFLDALINNGSTNDQINMLFMDILVAGTETSSSTIEWIMSELIKNPKYMKIVEEEIQRETNNGKFIKDSELPKLKFLQACFKETLRLHPPAPLLVPHRATEPCQVMNYTIPKNAQVMVNF